jgi:hypothetical protein
LSLIIGKITVHCDIQRYIFCQAYHVARCTGISATSYSIGHPRTSDTGHGVPKPIFRVRRALQPPADQQETSMPPRTKVQGRRSRRKYCVSNKVRWMLTHWLFALSPGLTPKLHTSSSANPHLPLASLGRFCARCNRHTPSC